MSLILQFISIIFDVIQLIMSQSKSWAQVVAQIQQSGLNLEKQKIQQNYQRYQILQKDLEQQINDGIAKKINFSKQKQIMRAQAEINDKKSLQREIRERQRIKLKQQKLRNQNYQLMQQKSNIFNKHYSHGYEGNYFSENPITAKLYEQSKERKKKTREENLQHDQINQNLMSQKQQQIQRNRQINNKQGEQFKNYVQSTFRRIDEDRYKFKKVCLDGKANFTDRFSTQPDSLQKQYSFYLQKQIAQKQQKLHKDSPIRSNSKVEQYDRITDTNILKINHDLDKQSSSPAYLGRIPSNHDRDRQLSYLNNQLKHRRVRTQISGLGEGQDGNKQGNMGMSSIINRNMMRQRMDMPQPSLFNQIPTNPTAKKQPQLARQQPVRQFKQFNILTGDSIIRNQYHSQVNIS